MSNQITLFPNAIGRLQVGRFWFKCMDGDEVVRSIFHRHYSRYIYADGRDPKLFVGPGEKLVLITADDGAIWVWRKFQSADAQEGINCAVFRRESGPLASELVIDADQVADRAWGRTRHYTYVNPRKIRSNNPGVCFIKAGWRRCGITKKRKLIILERAA